jgi:hypothetical protein
MPRFDLKTFLKAQHNPRLLLTPLIDQFFLQNDPHLIDEETIQLAADLMRAWNEERRKGVFGPSGALRCLREQTITASGHRGIPLEDPLLLNLFDDGHWRHLRWHTIFNRMGKAGLLRVIAIEEGIAYGAWGVYGTPDDILEIDRPDGPLRFVVDVKGANDTKFKEIKGTNEPLEGHQWQLHPYMQAHGLNLGVLLYENKNTQEYIEVRVRRNMALVKELRLRYKSAVKHKKRGTLPAHECSMKNDDPTFRRCPQRLNCIRLTKQGL